MPDQNFFDQFDSAPTIPYGPPPIPKAPDPIAEERLRISQASETRQARAQAEAAALAREKFDYQRQQDAAKVGKGGEASDPKVQARLANIDALTGQINRVQELYDANLKDEAVPILGSLLEYLPTPSNDQFNSAAAGMAEQGMAAFRVPGVGAQSDTELRQFAEANRPSNRDSDLAVEEKLRQLRARVDATREQMGLPRAQWAGNGYGSANPTPPALTNAPTALQQSTDGSRSMPDADTSALMDKMIRAGAPVAAINSMLKSRQFDPIDQGAYDEWRKFLSENPGYQGTTAEAIKTEQLSGMDAAGNALGGILGDGATAYLTNAGQFLSGNTLDNLSGDPEAARASFAQLSQDNPGSAFAGQMTGGILASLAGEAGLARLGMAGGFGRATLADAMAGAANGAGASDNGSRLGGALLGGLSSAAGSAGTYGLLRAGQKGAAALTTPVSRSLGMDENVAARQVAKALADDGITPRDAAAQLTDAQARGAPLAIADLGENSRELLASVGRSKGEARSKAAGFVGERQSQQLERLGAAVRSQLGPTANIREAGEGLIAQARQAAAPLYDQAYQAPGFDRVYPAIEGLINRPSMRKALSRAYRIAAEEGRDPNSLGLVMDSAGEVRLHGSPETQLKAVADAEEGVRKAQSAFRRVSPIDRTGRDKAAESIRAARDNLNAANSRLASAPAEGTAMTANLPTWQTLDYVKRGMDDVIEQYRDSTTGRLVLDEEGRAINGTLRAFLSRVDAVNPSYAQARAAYAGPARMKTALDKGAKAITRDPDDIHANLRDLSPSELEMYRLGARKGIMNLLESKGDYADKVNALIGTPKKRAALSRIFGGSEGFGNLQRVLSDEAQMGRTYRSVATGSQTAGRVAFDQGAHDNAATAIELAQATKTGGIAGLAATAWLKASEAAKLGAGPAGEAARSQIADILTASSADQLSDLARLLRRPEAVKKLSEAKGRAFAGKAARVVGAATGVAGAQAATPSQ